MTGLQKVKARWVPKLQSTWNKTSRCLFAVFFKNMKVIGINSKGDL
jgi:uncharacterized protein YjiK